MDQSHYFVTRASDKSYVQAFATLADEEAFVPTKATFTIAGGQPIEVPSANFEQNSDLQTILDKEAMVFSRITYEFQPTLSVSIHRHQAAQNPNEPLRASAIYDQLVIAPGQSQYETAHYARLIGSILAAFRTLSPAALGEALSTEYQRHYAAREESLARLETLTANLLREMEKTRRRRDQELESRTEALTRAYEAKDADLLARAETLNAEIAAQKDALDKEKEALDAKAAKHARREQYRKLTDKFAAWSKSFDLSQGTQDLRAPTGRLLKGLLIFSGLMASAFVIEAACASSGYSLFSLFSRNVASPASTAISTAHIVSATIRAAVFFLFFTSTAIYFFKWHGAWFERHAHEEFRLKRMELDIDRANWFVELAFQWRDENQETIPPELIDALARNLFEDPDQSPQVDHPMDIASRLTHMKVTKEGAEVELGRKGGIFRKKAPTQSNGS